MTIIMLRRTQIKRQASKGKISKEVIQLVQESIAPAAFILSETNVVVGYDIENLIVYSTTWQNFKTFMA